MDRGDYDDIFGIIISLILNMIAFLSIVIFFYDKISYLKWKKIIKQTVKEMEESNVNLFTSEMKEENEQFIKSVKDLKNEQK